MSAEEKVNRTEHEYRMAKVEYDYTLKQVRYYLASLAACRVKLNTTEQSWHDALEESGLPDPEEERDRLIRMLTLEGKRNGRVYSEDEIGEVKQAVEQRKSEEYHQIMLRKYREKKQSRA